MPMTGWCWVFNIHSKTTYQSRTQLADSCDRLRQIVHPISFWVWQILFLDDHALLFLIVEANYLPSCLVWKMLQSHLSKKWHFISHMAIFTQLTWLVWHWQSTKGICRMGTTVLPLNKVTLGCNNGSWFE